MKTLNYNWLTEGLIDFEYKKYVVLAYLQQVRKQFDSKKLYPVLSDVVFHYENLIQLKENKQLIYERFPDKISKVDFEKLTINYTKIIEDDEIMKEIEDILQFSLPNFKSTIEAGKEIYESIESGLEIKPIGITPLHNQEGYIFINLTGVKSVPVYEYKITFFENTYERYRGINLQFIENVYKNLSVTFESIKLQMINKYQKLPNPATFLIETNRHYPFEETLLPITKRSLVKYITNINQV